MKRFPLGKRSSHTLFDFISLSERMPYNFRWTKQNAKFCEEHPDESILIGGTFYVSISKAENNSPYDPLEL